MIEISENTAVICPGPLKDALLMMIASHRLKTEGRKKITTFSNTLPELAPWFCIHQFEKLPTIAQINEVFAPFETLILLFDTSPFCQEMIKLFTTSPNKKLYLFYPNDLAPQKMIGPREFVFSNKLCFGDNIASSISQILRTKHHSKSNGLSAPMSLNLTHRKHAKRVIIEKNTSCQHRLEALGSLLRKTGFEPHFIEKSTANQAISLVYESGYFIGSKETDLSTLASNLYIPSLLLKKKKSSQIKHTGWLNQVTITPPFWLTHISLPFAKRAFGAFRRLVRNHHELIS
jgi:hypothetical protein